MINDHRGSFQNDRAIRPTADPIAVDPNNHLIDLIVDSVIYYYSAVLISS